MVCGEGPLRARCGRPHTRQWYDSLLGSGVGQLALSLSLYIYDSYTIKFTLLKHTILWF